MKSPFKKRKVSNNSRKVHSKNKESKKMFLALLICQSHHLCALTLYGYFQKQFNHSNLNSFVNFFTINCLCDSSFFKKNCSMD